VAIVLIVGWVVYGKFVHPVNLGLNQQGVSGQPSQTVQNYIDQQNRKVALISPTMAGRIIRANPAKLGAS